MLTIIPASFAVAQIILIILYLSGLEVNRFILVAPGAFLILWLAIALAVKKGVI